MIFGWRKGESGNAAKPFEAQPDKARKFFEHARTVGEADQLEYALQLYANGLKLDPTNVEAHEGMYQVACKHHVGTGGAATGKDIKEIDGPSAIDKMVVAEYTWMRDLNNASAALRFLEAAGKAARGILGLSRPRHAEDFGHAARSRRGSRYSPRSIRVPGSTPCLRYQPAGTSST